MSADARTSSARTGLFASRPPPVAVEIARERVGAVALSESGGATVISSYAFEPLPAGVIEPSLNATNVQDRAALVGAISAVLEKAAPRARRVALVLPDTVGKVSLIRFEKVPGRAQDLDQLIRWQVRKTAPFRIEDALVSSIQGVSLPGGGREFVVTMARRDVIEGYEAACGDAGVHAGLVDLASFNLVNAVLAGADGGGDWLLVHVASDYATLAVVRGAELVFFRNRASAAEGELIDLVHQTAMYHEDRLGGGGFSRVVLTGAWIHGADLAERLRRAIEERLHVRVDPLDFREACGFSERIGVNPALLDALGPAVGVLLRERGGLRGRPAGQVA